MYILLRVLLLIAFSVPQMACSSTYSEPTLPELSAQPVKQTPPPMVPAKIVEILFQEKLGRPFALPLVNVMLNGHQTQFILDSGATDHVVASWLPTTLGLPIEKTQSTGLDHVGAAISLNAIINPKLKLIGWGSLNLSAVIVIDAPPILEELGIGGFLSPQDLIEGDGFVIVDLVGKRLLSSTTALIEIPEMKSLADHSLEVCLDDNGSDRQYIISSTLGEQPVRMLIDTGATSTTLFQTSAPGKTMWEKAIKAQNKLHTASGSHHGTNRTLSEVAFQAGKVNKEITVRLIPGESKSACRRDGMVGIDFLRRCQLSFSKTSFQGQCLSP